MPSTFENELKQYTNELHRRAFTHFPTRKVIAEGKNTFWCADMNDMSKYKDKNNGYAYILVIEDVFTRKAWAYPTKSKTAAEVLDCLKSLINTEGAPAYLWTDKGGEFYNKQMKDYLKRNGVALYSVYGQSKASPVERLNQTLKHIMFRILTERQSYSWVGILPDVVAAYNKKKHSVIGMTPDEAYAHPQLVERVEQKKKVKILEDKRHTPAFKLGDTVRISHTKGAFSKGYEANWTPEVFVITEIDYTEPITYRLCDLQQEQLEGSFYEQELQRTSIPDFALVEEILETRKRKGKVEKLVKWVGYPKKFNSWEPAANIRNL